MCSVFNNFFADVLEMQEKKDYKGIVELYKTTNPSKIENRIIFDMFMAFRKADVSLVEDFVEKYDIDIEGNYIISYGWCVWELLKQKTIPNNFFEFFNNLIQEETDNFLLINQIFNVIYKSNFDKEFILKFLELLPITKLDKNEITYNNKKFASNYEKYFVLKSKILFELKKYKESIEISEFALNNISNFHNNNDIWFNRRIALSYKELGFFDRALNMLEKIYSKKSEWFIKKEIAEIYILKNEHNIAYKLLIEVLNQTIPIEYKTGVIILFASILEDKQQKLKHLAFSKQIHIENEWKIPPIIQDIEEVVDKNEILTFWQDEFNKMNPLLKGVISKILHNEKRVVGFIKSDKDYYFSIPAKKLKTKIKEGINVKFRVVDGKVENIEID